MPTSPFGKEDVLIVRPEEPVEGDEAEAHWATNPDPLLRTSLGEAVVMKSLNFVISAYTALIAA